MNTMADIRYLPLRSYEQLHTRFDPELGIMWGFMNPQPRSCFNEGLLADLRQYVDSIRDRGGRVWSDGREVEVKYAVIGSKTPGIFNLGGDLALFREAIEKGDREQLLNYGRACIDNLHPWSQNCHLPLTTISLVSGDALGGGFECALASAVLVAEESTRMGFPEILFNLFPGMGAYSFLSRKVGRRITEELITSGSTYTARQLYDYGVVDVLAPDGMGEAAVYSYVRKHCKTGGARRAVERIRQELNPITYEELIRVTELWAETALQLDERDLRMMDRLVRAQNRHISPMFPGSDADQALSMQAAG